MNLTQAQQQQAYFNYLQQFNQSGQLQGQQQYLYQQQQLYLYQQQYQQQYQQLQHQQLQHSYHHRNNNSINRKIKHSPIIPPKPFIQKPQTPESEAETRKYLEARRKKFPKKIKSIDQPLSSKFSELDAACNESIKDQDAIESKVKQEDCDIADTIDDAAEDIQDLLDPIPVIQEKHSTKHVKKRKRSSDGNYTGKRGNLLKMMLKDEIEKERRLLLQCIKYIIDDKFLD